MERESGATEKGGGETSSTNQPYVCLYPSPILDFPEHSCRAAAELLVDPLALCDCVKESLSRESIVRTRVSCRLCKAVLVTVLPHMSEGLPASLWT